MTSPTWGVTTMFEGELEVTDEGQGLLRMIRLRGADAIELTVDLVTGEHEVTT